MSRRDGSLLAAWLAAAAAIWLAAGSAGAHPLAPALLELVETQPGGFDLVWKTPLQRPVGSDVRPELPGHCTATGPGAETRDGTSATLRQAFDCGRGLDGSRVAVRGLETTGTNALVRIALLDGRHFQAVLHAGAPELLVRERQTPLDVMADYGWLGVEHILSGLDHLVFVLGLVLLVPGARRLLYTVTAFTAGHSVTLSLAVLGYVSFPSAIVEIVIAMTILALALELARPASPRQGWMRRAPWLMAGSFGLLHGLGFAGALAEVGLPHEEIPAALFAFNLGIEAGQIAFVLGVVAARAALARPLARAPAWVLRAPVHAMGGLAVYWCLDRASGLLG
jgi:hydrogenase/urease accessory protein HupE